MLVRHNTKLLEQSIDLQVKRSAIPTLQAEAAAHEQIARATAFRRMATGVAIAVAAVGIGIGTWLVFDRDAPIGTQLPPVAQNEPETKEPTKTAADKSGESWSPAGEVVAKESKTSTPTPQPPATDPANPDTFDFVKFANRKVPFQGGTWELESGLLPDIEAARASVIARNLGIDRP